MRGLDSAGRQPTYRAGGGAVLALKLGHSDHNQVLQATLLPTLRCGMAAFACLRAGDAKAGGQLDAVERRHVVVHRELETRDDNYDKDDSHACSTVIPAGFDQAERAR